jgi:hypothetical protein
MTRAPKRLDPISLDALCEGSLDAGEAARLTEALRRRPGQRSWQTIANDEARYAKIETIGKTFWPNTNISECACQFHRALSQYHGGRWRRDRLHVECPSDLRPLHQQLWHLLKLHDRLLSEARLRRILGHELRGIHDQRNGSS